MFIATKLLPIFSTTVLPVFLIAAGGYALAWSMPLDGKTIGRMLFWLATPSLVFRSLYQMTVGYTTLGHTAVVAAGVTILAGLLGWLVAFDQERLKRAAIVLTSAVGNSGNMGIPISYFAFGEIGLALGSLYYVVGSFLGNTAGVVVASAGQTPLSTALRKSLGVPVLYAALLGLALNWSGVELPLAVFRAVDLLADAAIPGMLVLLGVLLRSSPMLQGQAVVWRSAAVRLLAAPLVAWTLCSLLGVVGVERNVLILQASMPTAVIVTVLATEYDTAPSLVATVILVTTAVSMATISVVLWLLS